MSRVSNGREERGRLDLKFESEISKNKSEGFFGRCGDLRMTTLKEAKSIRYEPIAFVRKTTQQKQIPHRHPQTARLGSG
jgi:hypothetical protein